MHGLQACWRASLSCTAGKPCGVQLYQAPLACAQLGGGGPPAQDHTAPGVPAASMPCLATAHELHGPFCSSCTQLGPRRLQRWWGCCCTQRCTAGSAQGSSRASHCSNDGSCSIQQQVVAQAAAILAAVALPYRVHTAGGAHRQSGRASNSVPPNTC
jgi:hypothetical protein